MMRVSSKLFCVIAFVVCLFPMLDNINGGVMAFHKEYINYKVMTTKNVDQVYRTGYHFQPKQNWINGTFNLSHIQSKRPF
ncbi:putative beta-fructofuranosidase [Helianthus annuus]|nr:putative beta-fructofuranosidase [Helianthus annuus]